MYPARFIERMLLEDRDIAKTGDMTAIGSFLPEWHGSLKSGDITMSGSYDLI